MLLILAAPEDANASAIASDMAIAGAPAIVTNAISDVEWELRLDTHGACAVHVLHRTSRAMITAIINLSGMWPDKVDDEFTAAEHTAAWWALLATFAGPVINRPTRQGLLPSLDRLRTAAVPGVWQGAWALRAAWTGGRYADRHALVQSAVTRQALATLAPDGSIAAREDVVEVTPCLAKSVHRVAVAGRRIVLLDVASPDRQKWLTTWLTGRLRQDIPALTTLIVECGRTQDWQVLDVAPLTANWRSTPAWPLILDGILEAVR